MLPGGGRDQSVSSTRTRPPERTAALASRCFLDEAHWDLCAFMLLLPVLGPEITGAGRVTGPLSTLQPGTVFPIA